MWNIMGGTASLPKPLTPDSLRAVLAFAMLQGASEIHFYAPRKANRRALFLLGSRNVETTLHRIQRNKAAKHLLWLLKTATHYKI